MTQAHNPELLFVAVGQVAERYNVSTDTIWRWSRSGDFPRPVKIGRNVTRWRLKDLLEHESSFTTCFAFCLDLAA